MFRKRAVLVAAISTFGFFLFSSAVVPALAQQQVTLEDGTVIVGDVSLAEKNVEIEVDGATLTFPLKEVAEVSSTSVASKKNAQLLLFRGLESLAAGQDTATAVGLLTEAYREAPEDPRIAYWFAWCLVKSGDGTAASEVFRMQEQTISAAYPRMANRLAEQIKERLSIELLPSQLVKRIDAISAGGERQAPNSESEDYAAYFRLTDQDEMPLEKNDFRVTTSGDSQNLEEFADGYFLFTFSRRRSYGASPAKIYVSRAGLETKQFEFNAVRNGVDNVGEFTVRRFGKQDLREVPLVVFDQNDNPLRGSQVLVRAVSNAGPSQNLSPQATDKDGKVSFELYPGRYSCSASFAGFVSANKTLMVPEGDRPMNPISLQLFPQVKAELRVEWRGNSILPNNRPGAAGEQVTTGELSLSSGQTEIRQSEANWINLRQREKKLYLSVQNYNYGYGRGNPGQAPAFWIGNVKPAKDAEASSPKEVFKELDLKKLEEMKEDEKFENIQSSTEQRGQFEILLNGKQGTIFVGNCFFRDNRTGQPLQTQFKVLLEKIED